MQSTATRIQRMQKAEQATDTRVRRADALHIGVHGPSARHGLQQEGDKLIPGRLDRASARRSANPEIDEEMDKLIVLRSWVARRLVN